MPVGDVYRVRAYCYDNTLTQVGINTWYLAVTAQVGTGALQAQIATSVDAAIAASYKACLSVNALYRGVTVQLIYTGGAAVIPPPIDSPTVVNAGAGTVAGNTLPAQVSGLISWQTSSAGRGYRGRVYIPFPGASAANAQGQMVAAYQASLGALAAAIFAAVSAGVGGNTSTLHLALQHDLTPAAPRPPRHLYSYPLVTNFSEPLAFATQRRRGQFGRINILPI